MAEYTRVTHTFEPVYNEESRILILGSFPSVKSREQGFYYGHPRNRFWQVISSVMKCPVPETIEEKKQMLLTHHIAIWDTISQCDIKGSSDSSICNVVPADIERVLRESQIAQIYANGKLSAKLYRKYIVPKTGQDIIELPSTSPANAAYSLERLVAIWNDINIM